MKQIVTFFLVGLVLLSVTVVYDGFFILKEGQQATDKDIKAFCRIISVWLDRYALNIRGLFTT